MGDGEQPQDTAMTDATAEQAEHLRLARIARETFARETGERVEPLRDLDSLPDWLVQLRAKGRPALHDYFEGLRRARHDRRKR
jgi:hypothetical protein